MLFQLFLSVLLMDWSFLCSRVPQSSRESVPTGPAAIVPVASFHSVIMSFLAATPPNNLPDTQFVIFTVKQSHLNDLYLFRRHELSRFVKLQDWASYSYMNSRMGNDMQHKF